jgi:hypothetical protein
MVVHKQAGRWFEMEVSAEKEDEAVLGYKLSGRLVKRVLQSFQ